MLMLLKFLCVLVASGAADSTVYDQRQSGKTNVRVDVKDAVIIAVGDAEFGGDYDYSYDYSDLTIKPSFPTVPTKKPTTETAAVTSSNTTQYPPKGTATTSKAPTSFSSLPNPSSESALAYEPENSTFTLPTSKPEKNGSAEPLKSPLSPSQIPVVVLQELFAANRPNKFLPVKTMNKQYVLSSQLRSPPAQASDRINTETLPARHCAPGFFLDNHNRCKRISRPARERTHLPIGFRYDHKPLGRPE